MELLGDDTFIERVVSFARAAAYSTSPILVIGETGTGKTFFSKMIASYLDNHQDYFRSIPLSEFPETLFESQLFGYKKGAFTGAEKNYQGILGNGENGILVLEEIDTLPLSLQPKILRLIESGSYYNIGSNVQKLSRARFIATSNRDLKHLVEIGEFRNDLYFRLNVLSFYLPPLRERSQSIPTFIDRVSKKYSKVYRRIELTFTEEVLNVLKNYSWPGNIRELNSEVERLYAFIPRQRNLVEINDINPNILEDVINEAPSSLLIELTESIEKEERQRLVSTLNKNKGNKSKTARELKVSRNHLYFLLKKYGI